MTNPNDPLFREVFACRTEDGQAMAVDLLSRNGYLAYQGADYVYGEGDIPLCLVAHTDTVHRSPPRTLYHDSTKRVVWSPEGLGADDRAGVFGIADLLRQGFRPHILFTDKEETGGIGAEEAALDLARPPVNLLIQMDRAGSIDMVFYGYDPPRGMLRYLRRHGFVFDHGTFTDIAVLMPGWGIGGVNLSIGYYGQHTRGEYLNLAEMDRTVDAVALMLASPPKPHPYRPVRRDYCDGTLALETVWSCWEDDNLRRLHESEGL